MVSFCDIPLSEVHKHVESYGSYGIGLTKKWAYENELNPVFYIESNSMIGRRMKKTGIKMVGDKLNFEYKLDLMTIWSYCKNYKGHLKRNDGREMKDYVFYNEREWRYVPSIEKLNSIDCLFPIDVNKYKADKDKYNDKLNSLKLTFKPEDIAYIIVKGKEEIPGMVQHIRSAYCDLYSATKLDMTFTKVISIEQIIEDF